jgi:carbonic anhydrase/acetyltransferase-like protein (isoleucine patch superfamily)
MPDYPLRRFLLPERQPQIPATCFVAPGAVVIGAVTLEEESSIWYTSVLRGDINEIRVGPQSNVQDGSVLHVSDDQPCVLGARVSVGHRAIVHAAEVGDEVLVGMGAIILDGARIGPRCVIAAGALVTKGTVVPEGSLFVGSPGRVVRALSAEEQQANARLALKYVEISRRYREFAT